MTSKKIYFHICFQLFVTTARLVFVNKKTDGSFKAFDMPMLNIYDETFKQPIFGANYLQSNHKIVLIQC